MSVLRFCDYKSLTEHLNVVKGTEDGTTQRMQEALSQAVKDKEVEGGVIKAALGLQGLEIVAPRYYEVGSHPAGDILKVIKQNLKWWSDNKIRPFVREEPRSQAQLKDAEAGTA